LLALPAHSDEPPQPLAAKEWVTLRAMSRFGAYGDVCRKHMPGMEGAWERALAGINETVDRLTAEQLGTPRFSGLDRESVPAARAAELRRGIDSARSKLTTRLEGKDPYDHCPRFLRNAQDFDDNALRPIVKDALAAFQSLFKPAPTTAPSAPRSRPAPRG
jgi:hypothetical protein